VGHNQENSSDLGHYFLPSPGSKDPFITYTGRRQPELTPSKREGEIGALSTTLMSDVISRLTSVSQGGLLKNWAELAYVAESAAGSDVSL
jgi:hypothetical protein